MSRTDADVEGFFNELDTDDTETLLELVAGLDPLAQKDGKPVFNGDEITLIGRFQQFAADYSVDDEDFDDEDDDDSEDDSEDIPGTGETEDEFKARVEAEQNKATADAADAPSQIDQNPGYDKVEATPEPKAWEPSLSDQALAEERRRGSGYGTFSKE